MGKEISRYQVVSTFSGLGGLDIGLEQAGLEIAVTQDFDEWCAETLRTRGETCILGDIRKLVNSEPDCGFLLKAGGISKKDVFAVVGGPPCQAFSTAGSRNGTEDPRGGLYVQFQAIVKALNPRFFIMENVKGLTSVPIVPKDKSSGLLLDTILAGFHSMGYSTVHGVLLSADYGTPQLRERLVIVGSHDGEPIFLPRPTHFRIHQDASLRWKTLEEAIGTLKNTGAAARFSPRIVKYMKLVPEGGNWRSLPEKMQREAMGGAYESGGGKVGFYRRLSRFEPSPTLVTSPIQKATLLCHPTENRPLSVREYARVQQLPDDWDIKGNVADIYRQIGNAVPAALGKALGQMLISVAEGSFEVKTKRRKGEK